MGKRLRSAVLLSLVGCGVASQAAKLVDVRIVDEQHIMIHLLDGEVQPKDDGKGPTAFMGHESGGDDKVINYAPPLNLALAQKPQSFSLTSTTDRNYQGKVSPLACFRRTKVNGVPHMWPEPPFTLEHILFLKLPQPMKSGATYTLAIDPATGSDKLSSKFTFDTYKSETFAIKVNLSGASASLATPSSADLYMWLGDGGARDYAKFAGKPVFAVNQKDGKRRQVGVVAFHKPSGPDYGGRNVTQSPVWTCDITSLKQPGTYRLAIPGVGASKTFEVRKNAFRDPFAMSVRGFYYMRIGEDMTMSPPPRQPQFIPGKSPVGFKVYRTTYGPYHPDWKIGGGDKWDTTDWTKYREPGEPTNPNAWGGHSDALDWDRHMGHVSIIYDMLLPYILSGGRLNDDKTGIRESGNGLPDLIEEAAYEVDFWLRLRDGNGDYSTGLNNPTKDHLVMHQAMSHPVMAWVNAANAAMLADAWRLAGQKALAAKYQAHAEEAWSRAKERALDEVMNVGDGWVRGRDLKMLAAACLYNLTGLSKYEDVVAQESVAAQPGQWLDQKDKACQVWATAAYLMCAKHKWQPIRHPDLVAKMEALAIKESLQKHVVPSETRPSRRASDEEHSWFQSGQHVQSSLLAHAVAKEAPVKARILRALVLEAEFGLGRNPLGLILMTGYGDRGVDDIYTSGRNDGVPGVHPGHTPYMNAEAWGTGYMADPKWMANKGYPAWEQWPHGEALWRSRQCYSNNEFTPQQTMRGKTALLGYLAFVEMRS
jgi:endoglucanase